MDREVDWIMIGVAAEDGVAVFATNKLTRAELTEEVEDFIAWDKVCPISRSERTVLHAEMNEYTVAIGRDWKEAFANLFRDWAPDPRDEIEPNPKQIGG
jgi:hypothetical protein